jgi:aminoglycoside phosphotransferase (APT) family kinase protein
VRRIRFQGTPAVAKQLIGAHARARFQRELTALTAAAGRGLVPTVFKADSQRNLLIMERLDFTEGMPPWPEYAKALARLHAIPPAGLPGVTGPTASDVEAFLRLCHALDVPADPAAEAELSQVLDVLAAEPLENLVHGDPCSGNVLAGRDGVRFVDFEQAGAGCGLAELAYLRIGFPTCGIPCRLVAAEIAEAEAAYLSVRGIRTDTLEEHCVGWLIRGDMLVQRRMRGERDQFARLLTENWSWGPETARQRLTHRLRVVAGFADRLPATAALCGKTADKIEAARPN